MLTKIAFWFQVIKHASPVSSAVRTLPTFISQVIFTVVGVLVVQKYLYLAPPAVLGNMIGLVGTALTTTFTIKTPAGKWIGYQVLVGSGRGLGLQQPFLVVLSNVEPSQLPVATAVVTWSQFIGGALILALGQTALANILSHSLLKYAPDVSQEIVLDAGATNYVAEIPAEQRGPVLLAYNDAITKVYYLAVAAIALGILGSSAMGRAKTAKKQEKSTGDGKVEKKTQAT